MSKLFLVTGATGATGSKTVKFLLEGGARVRAFAYREDDRSAALSSLGAEVVTGNLLDSKGYKVHISFTRSSPVSYRQQPTSPRRRKRSSSLQS